MAFGSNPNTVSRAGAAAFDIDVGLRRYMLGVYNYMASGLVLTGIVALLTASSPEVMQAIFGTPLKWVVMLAPLGLVFFMSARINQMQTSTAQTLFWVYAALMGLSLSSIFLVFTGTSIAETFFVSAAAFAGLSLYGYTTKKDLSAFGTFLIMGLWGIIIAGLVNIFLQSTMLHFITSAAGVLIFAGLTAWDTQSIKELYWEGDAHDVSTKKSVLGALTLYLDFVNLFMMLLQFMGVRRDN